MWPIARRNVFALVPSTTIAEKLSRAISILPISPPGAAGVRIPGEAARTASNCSKALAWKTRASNKTYAQ
jgi:hypothetical protein